MKFGAYIHVHDQWTLERSRSNEKEGLLFHECPDGIDIDESENLAKPPNGPGGWPGLPEGNPCNPHGHSVAQHLSLAPKNEMSYQESLRNLNAQSISLKDLGLLALQAC